jgi:hypothetical protein
VAKKPLKTQPTDDSVEAHFAAITDPVRQADCRAIAAMMAHATGKPARLWGTSIIGFGKYHYRYASGHEGDSCVIGLANRKESITLYFGPGLDSSHDARLAALGKYKVGKGCLYIKRLADIDRDQLEALLVENVARIRKDWPEHD